MKNLTFFKNYLWIILTILLLLAIVYKAQASSGDVNGSGGVDVDDITYLIAYVFQGGPAPVPVMDDWIVYENSYYKCSTYKLESDSLFRYDYNDVYHYYLVFVDDSIFSVSHKIYKDVDTIFIGVIK